MVCKECGSEDVQKYGVRRNRTGFYQRYKCSTCGATWRDDETIEEAKLRISEEK